jgi:hypothetical protein
MGGYGVHIFFVGGALTVVAFLLFCAFHIYTSPKGRRADAIIDCIIALLIWVLAFDFAIKCAEKHKASLSHEELASYVIPLFLLLLSLFLSFKKWNLRRK